MNYCTQYRGPDQDTCGIEACKWPCPQSDGAAHGDDDCRSINIVNSRNSTGRLTGGNQ